MFIVAQRGIRLKNSFYFWGFIALFGAVGLTMHVHYEPAPSEPLRKSENRSDDEAWYISVGEKQVGPTQFNDLVRLARQGLLNSDMQVWCPGENRWKKADDVPGLFARPTPWWQSKVLILLLVGVALLLIYGLNIRSEQTARPNNVGNVGVSQIEIDALRARVSSCWRPPPGVDASSKLYVVLRVLFKPDATMSREPVLVEVTASSLGPALAESAKQALLLCQPFTMLKPEHYDQWKDLELKFDTNELLRH